jgi:hypothetical protein
MSYDKYRSVYDELIKLIKQDSETNVIFETDGMFGAIIKKEYAINIYGECYAGIDGRRQIVCHRLSATSDGRKIFQMLNPQYSCGGRFNYGIKQSFIDVINLFDEEVQNIVIYNLDAFTYEGM